MEQNSGEKLPRETEMIREAKQRLRREVKILRNALPASYLQAAGDIIQNRVLDSEAYQKARTVFLYVGMPGEPPTDRILRDALDRGKGVYVPRCEGQTGIMQAVRIQSQSELRPGQALWRRLRGMPGCAGMPLKRRDLSENTKRPEHKFRSFNCAGAFFLL